MAENPGKNMVLYYHGISPHCRAVRLTMDLLSIKPEIKLVNILEGGNKTEEFAKINPARYIPVLVDGDYKLMESRAIMKYLVLQYGGKDNALYPRDTRDQSAIDRYLYFDACSLTCEFRAYVDAVCDKFEDESLLNRRLEQFEIHLKELNDYLRSTPFITGDTMTIADISIFTSLSQLPFFSMGHKLEKHEKVKEWFKRCRESMPKYAEFEEGMEELRAFAKQHFSPKK